ncbi:MAG: orotate phosphoribosyltransferase [Cyclobacteriaceae bacterium]|nr:orotate phosphoribosyltransferase [Cyclobacteriaceae bacterium]
MQITIMPSTAGPVASKLLEIGAIKLNTEKPFTWSSGWKSPIYCDNRLSLSYPHVRSYIKRCLAQAIRDCFPDTQAIAGVATAGIPQGALVAEELHLPFLYVRPKPKDHGLENLIEGKLEKGQRVVLIEDLISTGGSSLKAAASLKDGGAQVLGMAAIFTYGFDTAEQNFSKDGIKLICLSDFPHLLEEALLKNFISPDQLAHIKAWRLDPANWK